jgi:hypothetical protein
LSLLGKSSIIEQINSLNNHKRATVSMIVCPAVIGKELDPEAGLSLKLLGPQSEMGNFHGKPPGRNIDNTSARPTPDLPPILSPSTTK